MVETSTPEIREKLWSMIKGIGVAMLTTEDGGHLRARPMHAAQTEFDGTLWFFTLKHSHKVEEVEQDHTVGVSFADGGKQDYVSMSGQARLVVDKATVEQHWSEPMRTWFPKGIDDPEIALIKVTVEAAEYWDAPNSTVLHAYGYVKAALTGEAPKPGENKKVAFT